MLEEYLQAYHKEHLHVIQNSKVDGCFFQIDLISTNEDYTFEHPK